MRDALGRLGRIEAAFVYGSVAAGTEDAYSDLDLMLVGEADLQELAAVVSELEANGRAINDVFFTADELGQPLAEGDPFIRNVLSGPKLMLIGDEDDLR